MGEEVSPALVQASSAGAGGGQRSLESRSGRVEADKQAPRPRSFPTRTFRPGWGGGAGLALGEFQACEALGLWPWTGTTRRGGRACCPPGPRREGLALSPDAPQNTPQTIPSYLAKAHVFFSKFEDSVNRRKRILWKEEEDEPRAGGCFRRWQRVVFTGRGKGEASSLPLEGPAGAPARPPARRQQDQWRHLNLQVPPYTPPTPQRALLPQKHTPGTRCGT